MNTIPLATTMNPLATIAFNAIVAMTIIVMIRIFLASTPQRQPKLKRKMIVFIVPTELPARKLGIVFFCRYRKTHAQKPREKP